MIPRAEAVVAIAIILAIVVISAFVVFHPQASGASKDLLLAGIAPLATALGGVVHGLASRSSNPTKPVEPAKE